MVISSKVIEMTKDDDDMERTSSGKEYAPGLLIIFVAEIYGTAMLVFLGCMGVCVPELIQIPIVPHFGSIGFGLALLIVIQSIGHVSGAHLNPQVTLAAVILGKIKPIVAPVYFVAEFIGALVGFGLLKLVSPESNTEMCATMPHSDITIVQAVAIEIIITCVLVIVCCSIWDPRNAKNTDSISIRFGFILAGLCISAGSYTGASMNTARSFAPALINGNWDYHWIYWVAPTVGALIGSLFYRFILSSPKS